MTAAATAVINKNGMGRIGEIFKWKNKAGYLDAQTDSKGILISQIAVLTGGFAIPTAKAGGQRVIRKILILGLGLLLAWGWPVLAAPLPTNFRLAQTETVFYPKDSIRPIAACKVAEVFWEPSPAGIFFVPALPRIGAARRGHPAGRGGGGQRLDAGTGFQACARPGRAGRGMARSGDLATSRTDSPHLHARSARLMEAKDPVVCRLENCVIEADGQRWHAARANWQMAGNRHELAWRTDDGQAMRWDLSTGEIFTNNQIGKN